MYCCRFYALFHEGGVTRIEPLTPGYHLIDLRVAQPDYMRSLVCVMHAVKQLCQDLCREMAPHTEV